MMFPKKPPSQVQTRQREVWLLHSESHVFGFKSLRTRTDKSLTSLAGGLIRKRVIEYYTTHNTERTGVTTVRIDGCSSLEDVLTRKSPSRGPGS